MNRRMSRERSRQYLLHSRWGNGSERAFFMPLPCIMDAPMTAILAWMNGGDLCLAADGLSSGSPEFNTQHEYKTARINDNAAIGFASSLWHAWLLLAHLFEIEVPHSFPNISEEWASIVSAIEAYGISRPRLDFDSVCHLVNSYDPMRHPHPDGIPFEAIAVLASSFDGVPRLTVWNSKMCWTGMDADLKRPAIFAPGTDETLRRVSSILEDSGLHHMQKVRECLHEIASEKPYLVNENGTLRRSTTGFALELAYRAPSNSTEKIK